MAGFGNRTGGFQPQAGVGIKVLRFPEGWGGENKKLLRYESAKTQT